MFPPFLTLWFVGLPVPPLLFRFYFARMTAPLPFLFFVLFVALWCHVYRRDFVYAIANQP